MAVEVRFVTLEDYQAAFAEQPVEIVDGEIEVMSPYGRKQPNAVTNLMLSLGVFVRDNNLSKVYSEASFVLDGEVRTNWVRNARTPDLSFIIRDRINAHEAQHTNPDNPWWLAPDLAVEVVSPTDQHSKVLRKIKDYLHYGVVQVWIIDPKERAITIHTADNPLGTTLEEDETLTAEALFPGWSMPVAALFAV